MDQRARGGAPPSAPAHSPLPPTTPPEDSERDAAAERRRRGEGESGGTGRRDEERRGAGRRREGDRGAVLELLIEGRCGSAGQRQLPFPGRESNCSEGNVKLRIGLQAKRTKKPPKILESYVCKPTIRTYQRPSRGSAPRRDSEGGGSRPQKPSPAPEEADGAQSPSLEPLTSQSRNTPSSSPLPPSSSSSLPPPSAASSPTTPRPASAPASPAARPAKQVLPSLIHKTEMKSGSPSDRLKRDKLPDATCQSASPGHNPTPSPRTDQTGHTSPSSQNSSAFEPRREGDATTLDHPNGTVQVERQGALLNGKGSAVPGPTKSTKTKGGKHSTSISPAPGDTNAAERRSASSSHKKHAVSHKKKTESSCPPSVPPKPLSSALTAPSSGHSHRPDSSLENNKKAKEEKGKKEKRKDKKAKHDRKEVDRAKSDSRKEEGKKKKKGKDGKLRAHRRKERARDERQRDEMARDERGKEKRMKDHKLSPDSQREAGAADDHGRPEQSIPEDPGKAVDEGSHGEVDEPGKPEEPAPSADAGLPQGCPGAPPKAPTVPTHRSDTSLSLVSNRSPTSPPSSPPEQDSRPLKKRKARRPSWTKLVQRAQRAESQEGPPEAHRPVTALSGPLNPRSSPPAKASTQQAVTPSPSHSSQPGSPPLPSPAKPHSAGRHPSPTWEPALTSDLAAQPAPKSPVAQPRKRGRPKSQAFSVDESWPRHPCKAIQAEVLPPGGEGTQEPPVLEISHTVPSPAQANPTPRKRGRPPKRATLDNQRGDALARSRGRESTEDFHRDNSNRQMKINRLIDEMKRRNRKRLHEGRLFGNEGIAAHRGGEMDRASPPGSYRPSLTTTMTTTPSPHAFPSLSSSFGCALAPQINVSKRGTIYMGKRRGRKPKAQSASAYAPLSQSSRFPSPSESSLFSLSQAQPPSSHPFPSPSLTHSSGAQSPYSDGSFTEPAPSLLFPHPFSLPSPSSSCTSPRPPSSASLSTFVKKSCPCQGRLHFPFHQSSCKLSAAPPHLPSASPARPKDATPSPRSESHSEETLPSDSGIGTDNNSVSERGELRAGRGLFRMGQGSGLVLGSQRHPSSLMERPSPVCSPLSTLHKHPHPVGSPAALERHRERERHRHRRRGYDCVPSCPCVGPYPCPGHGKCSKLDYYPCQGHGAVKRPKSKHKKKHQQLPLQDPDFLSELEELIGLFGEVHIGRRGWARSGAGQGFDGRRHHSSSTHPVRSNIFRINLNGYYSPHPSSYPVHPSFPPHPFYPCQALHCGRKPERRQCGCPSTKLQESMEDLSYYRGYPPAAPLYPHLHSSFPLPPPHQYAPQQAHHPHLLLNPARFHRRRSRLLREGGVAGEADKEVAAGGGFPPPCCGRSEHKHKRKHRHRHGGRAGEEENQGEEEEDAEEVNRSKPRSGFTAGSGGERKGSARSMESPWQHKQRPDPFSSSSSAAAGVPSSSLSSSSSAGRLKHAALTSLGLGSSHLSSFGGSWGGLGSDWMKTGGLRAQEFGASSPSWRTFAGGQQAGKQGRSEREEDDEEDDEEDSEQTHLYGTSPPPTHTNLFTSVAVAAGGRAPKSGRISWSPGSGDGAWAREEPVWTERRGEGGHSDWTRRQQKGLASSGGVLVKRRGPGRPRKHPLPSPVSSAPHSPSASPPRPAAASLAGPSLVHHRGDGGRGEDRGGDKVRQVIQSVVQAKRKRGRKRKHAESPCRQSAVEGVPECDAPTVFFGQSSPGQAAPHMITVQCGERPDRPPRKRFQRAGLYSDDYKTTDPPSQPSQVSSNDMEYTPGQLDYSLLPAPIHVGKYLRLKKIDFQLPYDVMWLWRHNQLHREPAVPMKRKRSNCRPRERTTSSRDPAEECSGGMTDLFPHLDLEPMTGTERSFVVKHHVFLVRNWELVRERQIQLRMERGSEREAEEERDRLPCDLARDGVNGGDGYIKSGQPVGVQERVVTSDPHHPTQETSSSRTTSPHTAQLQSRREDEDEEEEEEDDEEDEEEDEDEEEEEEEEEKEEEKEKEKERQGEKDLCRRDMQRKRLNNLLLTLPHV